MENPLLHRRRCSRDRRGRTVRASSSRGLRRRRLARGRAGACGASGMETSARVRDRHINDLPGELLGRIFNYLHLVDDTLPLLALVCHKWRSVLQNAGFLWRVLHVDPTRYGYWHFSLLCSILRVYGHHIQKLTWREQSPVYESVFSLIPRLLNLRHLRLPILWTRAVVEGLAPLAGLEQIQVNGGFALTDGDLQRVGGHFSRLREVSLNACWQVTAGGALRLLQSLPLLQSVKLKINSGLPLSDSRSERAMREGARVIQKVANSHFARLVSVLCIHFVPLEMDELWDTVKNMTNMKKLTVSNCEHLHGIRLVTDSLQKFYVYNLWNVLFISINASNLRLITIDYGLESMEHIDLLTPKLRRARIDGSNVLHTIGIKSERLVILELSNCEAVDMRVLMETLRLNSTIVSLKLGCISQDSLTLDEYTIPNVQELCLLSDFSCETIHIRSPTLRLLHTEAENDIITLNHVYITANHLCKVALIGLPALKTMTIQCVSVDCIELNLCSDDQLTLESCVIHAMGAIGFLRLFDCKLNLLSVCTPLAKTIVLYRCQMSDYVLQMALTGCPNIAYLNLEKCRNFEHVAIQTTLLRYLNMFGCTDVDQLELQSPDLLALNLGQCPKVRLFIQGIEQSLTELCDHPEIVLPTQSIRWSHDFPPKVYICS